MPVLRVSMTLQQPHRCRLTSNGHIAVARSTLDELCSVVKGEMGNKGPTALTPRLQALLKQDLIRQSEYNLTSVLKSLVILKTSIETHEWNEIKHNVTTHCTRVVAMCSTMMSPQPVAPTLLSPHAGGHAFQRSYTTLPTASECDSTTPSTRRVDSTNANAKRGNTGHQKS